MALTEETLKILLQIEQQNVDQAKQKLTQLESQFKSIGVVAPGAFKQIENEIKETVAQLTRAESNVQNVQKTLKGGFSLSTGGLTQGITQAAYALDDLQYVSTIGFRAISNNITPVLAQFGIWGSLLSAVIVGIGAFGPSLEEIGKALGLTAEQMAPVNQTLEAFKAKIDEINAKPLKFQDDYDALDKYKEKVEAAEKALAGFNALKDKGTSKQEAAGKQVEDIIPEKGNNTGDGRAGAMVLAEQIDKWMGENGAGDILTAKHAALDKIDELEQERKDLEASAKGAQSLEQASAIGQMLQTNEKLMAQAKADLAKADHDLKAAGLEEGATLLSQAAGNATPEVAEKARAKLLQFAKERRPDLVADLSKPVLSDEEKKAAKEKEEADKKAAKEQEDAAKKEAKEQEDAAKREAAAKQRIEDFQQKEFEKEVKDVSNDLFKGELGTKALTGDLDFADVAQQLEKMGLDTDLTLPVTQAVREKALSEAQGKAAEEGITTDEAGQKIADERREKEAKEAQRQADQRFRAAKDAAPGIEKLIGEGLKNGMNPAAIQAQLVANGFGESVAGRLVGEGVAGEQERKINEALNPEISNSQIFGSADFANAIQGGVSDESKRQTEKLENIRQLLSEMKDQSSLTILG